MYKQYLALATLLAIATTLVMVIADETVDPASPRQCFSCSGINCQRTSKLNSSASCTDLLDYCVTVFDGFTVVAKGCYLDMPTELRAKCDTQKNPECFKCFGQLCNNKGRADSKCIECNSKDNSKCSSDTSTMAPIQCPVPTAPNSYCFVRQSGKEVSRGCFVHMQDQLACMSDKSCSMCLTEDDTACNSFTVSANAVSGANKGVVISLATLFLVIFVSFA